MNFVFLIEEPDLYEAYLYKVRVHSPESMKFYGGSKKGKVDRTYYGSPETNKGKYFQDIAQYGATIEILNFGNYTDIIYLEKQMLKEVDAKYNPEYYNGSNLTGQIKTQYNSILVDQINDAIKNREYPIIAIPKLEVAEYETHQIRLDEIIWSHVVNITDHMNASEGGWLKDKDPVVVLEDYGGKGEPLLIGGHHTTQASLRCKFVSTLEVQFIPKKVWKKLDLRNIKELAAMQNPQEQNIRLPQSEDDEIIWIVEECEARGFQPDSEHIHDRLVKHGWTPAKIKRGLIPKAKNQIAINATLSSDESIINWESAERKKELQVRKDAALTKGIHMIDRSSGFLRGLGDDIIDIMYHNPNCKRIKILIRHIKPKQKEIFETQLQPIYQGKINMIMDRTRDKRGNKTIEISFEILPFTHDTPLKESV